MRPGDADPGRLPRQPIFGFPAPAAKWSGLLESASNAAALRIAGKPEEWIMPALSVTGPAKCGLSYLAEAWASRFGGVRLDPHQFARGGRRSLDALSGMHVALDDADLAAAKQDEALLSLINLNASGGGRLLLLSHRPASQWRTQSADLKSRLNALPVAEIKPPDEQLLRERLAIAAERRFLRLSPETLTYLVPRLELAYEAIENFMDALSDAVTTQDRAPSLPLARLALEQVTGAGEGDEAQG